MNSKQIDWTQIISFTSSGIVIADYSELRNAIIARFKEIYGSDIDLSTATVDGIYIETYCLVVNNILQAFKQLYANLDINTASGAFLDILCNLSNVSRKVATNSTASLILTYQGTAGTSYKTKELSFVDRNGNEWVFKSDVEYEFVANTPQTIVVTCAQSGPVRADAGWIDTLLTTEAIFTISQPNAAELGTYNETDSQLRARRNKSAGAIGNSVLESLVGALINITGIDDAKIYNNDSASDITAKDGTTVKPHQVYVILRKRNNISIADSLLGTIIYEKMTPGIKTVQTTDSTTGISKTYNYQLSILGNVEESLQKVYWKEAKAVNKEIVITITTKENFASINNSTAKAIANNVIDYMNNLQLSEDVTANMLENEVEYADPLFRGRRTFSINSITINASTSYTNPDTYFNYTNTDITTSGNTVTIKLS